MGSSRIFYPFLGLHSFLIGLFPFFLPVYLLKTGYSISQIALFISITGLSFCVSLYLWDRLRLRSHFVVTIILTFVLETALLALLLNESTDKTLPLLAFVNGMYNCLFWIVQRVLFLSTVSLQNAGRKFGNFQIYVLIVLKTGMFVGGFLLETWGIVSIFVVSLLTSIVAIAYFIRTLDDCNLPAGMNDSRPLSLAYLFNFRDTHRSRYIFSIDGVFLFLESYFWLITLFLLVHENFWQLSILVIILAIIFSLLFIAIKNRIDVVNSQRVYVIAVCLYVASWLMRGVISSEAQTLFTFVLLISITFCTSFFRLAFNKRFFDLAKKDLGYPYILIKSYISQFFIMLFFGIGALGLIGIQETEIILRGSFFFAACISPLYFLYRK